MASNSSVLGGGISEPIIAQKVAKISCRAQAFGALAAGGGIIVGTAIAPVIDAATPDSVWTPSSVQNVSAGSVNSGTQAQQLQQLTWEKAARILQARQRRGAGTPGDVKTINEWVKTRRLNPATYESLCENALFGPQVNLFNDLPRMSAETVKRALQAEKYAGKDTSWAYSIHQHHIYPKWLGGSETGPQLAVRGYEHLRDLEPALRQFIQQKIPQLTQAGQANAGQVQQLLQQGKITQKQITDALTEFYKMRYPTLSQQAISGALGGGG